MVPTEERKQQFFFVVVILIDLSHVQPTGPPLFATAEMITDPARGVMTVQEQSGTQHSDTKTKRDVQKWQLEDRTPPRLRAPLIDKTATSTTVLHRLIGTDCLPNSVFNSCFCFFKMLPPENLVKHILTHLHNKEPLVAGIIGAI